MLSYSDDFFFCVWKSNICLIISFTIYKNPENKYPFLTMNRLSKEGNLRQHSKKVIGETLF